jgi:hypothetical protein
MIKIDFLNINKLTMDIQTILTLNEQVEVAKMFIDKINNNFEITKNKEFANLFRKFIDNSIMRSNIDSSLISLPILIARSNKDYMSLDTMKLEKETVKCINFEGNIFDFIFSLKEIKRLGIDASLHFPGFEITLKEVMDFVIKENIGNVKKILAISLFIDVRKELETWISLYKLLLAKKEVSTENSISNAKNMRLFLPFYKRLVIFLNEKFNSCSVIGKKYLEAKSRIEFSSKEIKYGEEKITSNNRYFVNENEKITPEIDNKTYIIVSDPYDKCKVKKNKLKLIKKDYSFLFDQSMILKLTRNT